MAELCHDADHPCCIPCTWTANANRFSLVDYQLPEIPTSCSMVGAAVRKLDGNSVRGKPLAIH